jgi:Cu(I)/Ag(I) efflux system membrane protein CusA/SilA
MDGALLRLRPKVMTVATVVAGLLPIMWSTRTGAEVMKPLATPVLGGMVSSLLHVLIVTPVLFCWLRERQLHLQHEPMPAVRTATNWRRLAVEAMVVAGALVIAFAVWTHNVASRSPLAPTNAGVVHSVRSGDVDVVLLSPTGALHQGRNQFTVEFRRAGTDTLIDVGTARASANMTMPGMAMSSGLQLVATGVPGRFAASAEFGMAGAWQMAVEWDGPAGRGSVRFDGGVQ